MPLLKTPSGSRNIHYHDITDVQAESALAVSGECYFAGIVMTAENTDQDVIVTFDIYDSLVAGGTRLIPNEMRKVFEEDEDNYFTLSFDPPLRAVNGIYVDLVELVGSVHYQVVYDQ